MFGLTMFFFIECHAGESADLLEQVRIGHRSARESIRTFSAKFSVDQSVPRRTTMASGQYWQSGEIVRIQTGTVGSGTDDVLIRNGESRKVGTTWNEKGARSCFALRESDKHFHHWTDIWCELLIGQRNHESERGNYDATLDRITAIASVSRERFAGRDCIRIEATEKVSADYSVRLIYWHHIGYNYLICKKQDGNALRPECGVVTEVEEFAEPEPGVFIPVKVKLTSRSDGKILHERVTVLKDVVVNQPIISSVFMLPDIPRGTDLQDTIARTVGPIDAHWKSIGKTTPMPKGVSAPAPAQDVKLESAQSQSHDEPWTMSQIVLIICLSLLAVCGLTLAYRKLRSSRHQPET